MSQQHPFSSKTIRLAVIAPYLLLLIGTLHGCLIVYTLDVKMTADGLVFSNDLIEEGMAKNKRYILSSLSVVRHDPCDDPYGCRMWVIARSFADGYNAALLEPPNLISLPIRYGQFYSGMEVIKGPVPLTPGHYSLGGGIVGSSHGIRFDISLSFSNEFILKENAQGLLEVEEVRK